MDKQMILTPEQELRALIQKMDKMRSTSPEKYSKARCNLFRRVRVLRKRIKGEDARYIVLGGRSGRPSKSDSEKIKVIEAGIRVKKALEAGQE